MCFKGYINRICTMAICCYDSICVFSLGCKFSTNVIFGHVLILIVYEVDVRIILCGRQLIQMYDAICYFEPLLF